MPAKQDEPIVSVLTSTNSTYISKPVLNNNTSEWLCMLFAMTSKVRKKRKNFKINRKGEILKKKTLKAEDIPLYRKTWLVCITGGRSSPDEH